MVELSIGLQLARIGGAAAPDLTFAEDSFTDVSGTLLQNHTPEIGGPWIKHAISANDAAISNANRCRNNGNSVSTYIVTADSDSADYSVFCDLVLLTDFPGVSAGVVGRCDPVANTMYIARYQDSSNVVHLLRYINGGGILAGSGVIDLAPGTYRLELRMIGDQISVLVDNAVIIAVTNAEITAAGRAGIYINQGSSDTTGEHIDNFLAVNAAP